MRIHRTPGVPMRLVAAGFALALVASGCTSDDDSASNDETAEATEVTVAPDAVDRAYNILPPGNYGGLPTSENSLDQLPLYDGLTPLRGDITDEDIEEYFLPEDFEPIGATTEEPTGRAGTTILYDEWGIPHITGETREDLAFGAGWVSARDRGPLLELGRGPARAAVADIPGIDAFDLVTSAQEFIPSEAAEQLVSDQADLIVEELGPEGEEIISDAQAYADGMTAYWEANNVDQEPATVNDVIAVTAFIGSIFGAGGGDEASNAEFLSTVQNGLGDDVGQKAWEDVMLFDDPEAPTTIEETFDYGVFTSDEVTGSVVIDEGSVESFDPLEANAPEAENVLYEAAGPVPARLASNWQLVERGASANGTTLGVMGPQLGYFYPEIVQQMHLSGPGIEAQGAAVPGLAMYLLIGRTEDYAWSLTSASHDVRDVFAETLCNPDGSEPTRASEHYEFEGECRPFETFDAGTLNGVPISYLTSEHGPVVGTALSEGKPVALARQRSTLGRDGLNLGALKNMTEGDAVDPEAFYETANQFGFTFNWAYINRDGPAFFSSGLLPVRADGLDRRLPTLGNGEYEWQGFLEEDEHPHAAGHPSGIMLNWNNQSAPGFMHGDTRPYGSMHRVELFDQFPDPVDLAGVVGVMNRSATEFPQAQPWPVVSEVLRTGDAPTPLAGEVADLMDAWLADDAPAVDADDDGNYDESGPTIMEALWEPLASEVIRPVFGELTETVYEARDMDDSSGHSIVDKDLRTVLDQDVEGEFELQYCGEGDLVDCRDSLWAVVDSVSQKLAEEHGDDPSTWLTEALRIDFEPGLIPDTFRATNRPTFQQVLELIPPE